MIKLWRRNRCRVEQSLKTGTKNDRSVLYPFAFSFLLRECCDCVSSVIIWFLKKKINQTQNLNYQYGKALSV